MTDQKPRKLSLQCDTLEIKGAIADTGKPQEAPEDCCGTCRFSAVQQRPLPNGQTEMQTVCRRNPPQTILIPKAVKQSPLIDQRGQQTEAFNVNVTFVPVAPAMWCGEFRPKPEVSG